MLSIHKINNGPKLTHLLAKDLFAENVLQVFDARTGKNIGSVNTTRKHFEFAQNEEDQEPEPEIVVTNQNQLSLF